MVVIMSNDRSTHIKTGLIFIGVSIGIGVLLYLLFALGVSSDPEQITAADESTDITSSIISDGDDKPDQEVERITEEILQDDGDGNYCKGRWFYNLDQTEDGTPFIVDIRSDGIARYEASDEPPFEVEYMWGNVEGYVDFPYRDTETRFLLGPCDKEAGRSRVRVDSESGSRTYDMVLIGD